MKERRKERRLVFLLVFLIVLAVLPLLNVLTRYHLSILTLAMIYVIFASSWDLLCGLTDQINFGYALFIGVSSYTVAFIQSSVHFTFVFVCGALVAMLFALVIGYPCLRLRGPYLALATFVFPLILIRLAFTFSGITGGEYGFIVVNPFGPRQLYWISLCLAFITLYMMYILAISKFGKTLRAIGENEEAALAGGINVTYFKILAYCISGFFGGLGGVLYTYYIGHVSPHSFDMWISVGIVTMAMVGGMGTIIGPALGALLLSVLAEGLRGIEQFRTLIYSSILIISMLLLPQGLWGLFTSFSLSRLRKGVAITKWKQS